MTVARRTFLPGEEGEWIDLERTRRRQILVRGLECLSETCLQIGDLNRAAQCAADVITIEPLREIGYQLLMKAHIAEGNRAEAVKVYNQCREALLEDLGIDPSPETEALYLQAVQASVRP